MLPPKETNHHIFTKIPAKLEFLAKTVELPDGTRRKGVNVLTHCITVGLVARELIRRQPDWLRAALFPPGCELLAAAHDIGKISPGFQQKIHIALNDLIDFMVSPQLDRSIGGHAAVSRAALRDSGDFVPEIVGRHHGTSPLKSGLPDDTIYGGPAWQQERLKTIDQLKMLFSVDWPTVTSDIQADVLSGLTTVADWVGSGQSLSLVDEKIESICLDAISAALDSAGFVRPLLRAGLTFENVFRSYTPFPAQQLLIDSVRKPGVYVLEAPMGLGKTEAALFAAYEAMVEGRATGIYFALPTQLTSEKIVARMNYFLGRILEDNCPHRKALLLHGNAWLKQTHMAEEGAPGRSWFDYRKRGLLAPFAVGTIDQALMAAMNVKHGFVRTFGLAGKVVILDEVHSYDSYTGTIIDHLVEVLRQIQCTVIILSATLTKDRRHLLLNSREHRHDPSESAYPLVSQYPTGHKLSLLPVEATEHIKVSCHLCQEDHLAVAEALQRAENGEQVLWIENTVDEAQQLFKMLGARAVELGMECGLLHSRFLKTDREEKENYWVEIFGKGGQRQRGLGGRILVGTQVLEQSLDIDGDFLVSRICPTDMLLQRIGRLWRHRANDPLRPRTARRALWILAPPLEDAIQNERCFGKTAAVYSPYVLCRSQEVWQKMNIDALEIQLPEQMRELIEATYSDRAEEGTMARYKYDLGQVREKLARLANIGLSRGGRTLPESKATTRYSETESVEVLLVKSKRQEKDGVYLKLLDDSVLFLPKGARFVKKSVWRLKAADLRINTVSVPEKKAPAYVDSEIKFLKEYVYLGDEEERPFRLGLVRPSGRITGLGQQESSDKFELSYDPALGYIANAKKD
ncbi:MAG: CRISPR-associated helicase Cas3' [Desulfobacteraceae bacterium]|nr:CRISPR-associated helicase Cas3' [Desulfobacteraceae bacterium]